MGVTYCLEAELAVCRLERESNWVAQDRNFGHAKVLAELKSRIREVEMPEDYMRVTFVSKELSKHVLTGKKRRLL